MMTMSPFRECDGDAPAALVDFAFDLVHLDGEDLMQLPLFERKARLEALSGAPAVIRFSSHVVGNGAQVSEAGSKLGVEGMVSKQINKPPTSRQHCRAGSPIAAWPDRDGFGTPFSVQMAPDDSTVGSRRLWSRGTESTLESSSERSGNSQQWLTHSATAGTDDINDKAPPKPAANRAIRRIERTITLAELFIARSGIKSVQKPPFNN
jgi:hypothetical protein